MDNARFFTALRLGADPATAALYAGATQADANLLTTPDDKANAPTPNQIDSTIAETRLMALLALKETDAKAWAAHVLAGAKSARQIPEWLALGVYTNVLKTLRQLAIPAAATHEVATALRKLLNLSPHACTSAGPTAFDS